MIQLVSRILHRAKNELTLDDLIAEYQKRPAPNIVVATGMLVYHVQRRGYFGIIADDGRQFFPCNAKQFPKLLKDRLRVRFVLESHQDVPNFYDWGTTCRVMSMEMLIAS